MWPAPVPIETVTSWRDRPPTPLWRWVWASREFGLWAPLVGWLRYEAMLDDLERFRRETYSPLIGPYWEQRGSTRGG
jgi:hypothetical protein